VGLRRTRRRRWKKSKLVWVIGAVVLVVVMAILIDTFAGVIGWFL